MKQKPLLSCHVSQARHMQYNSLPWPLPSIITPYSPILMRISCCRADNIVASWLSSGRQGDILMKLMSLSIANKNANLRGNKYNKIRHSLVVRNLVWLHPIFLPCPYCFPTIIFRSSRSSQSLVFGFMTKTYSLKLGDFL